MNGIFFVGELDESRQKKLKVDVVSTKKNLGKITIIKNKLSSLFGAENKLPLKREKE
jgi:hypothetical protein